MTKMMKESFPSRSSSNQFHYFFQASRFTLNFFLNILFITLDPSRQCLDALLFLALVFYGPLQS